jgi:ABC-type nitrate/sulfonate/bicarbonate transport system permease component
MQPWEAGLIIGGVILLLSVLGIWITIAVWNKRTQTQLPEKPALSTGESQASVDSVAHLGEIVGASLSKSGIRTTDVMIAALVAGTILGASPSLRRRLSNRKRHKNPSHSSNDDVFDKYS